MSGSTRDARRLRWGAVLFLARPAYLAVELAVAAATTGSYSLVDDTVSDLGASTCTASYCSPGHVAMNAAFVGFGLLLVVGALLLAPATGRAAALLLVVSGLSSVAVGLAPVDQDPGLHTLAAAPLFLAQPVALLLLARRLRARRAVSRALAATALLAAAGALGFVLLDGGGAGALERLALWPVLVALAVAGLTSARAVPGRGGRPSVEA